ncbi:hypothetical protein LY76DRAFT_510777, partial [Colletotrichum caudatum]
PETATSLLPEFSTATDNDRATAAMAFTRTMQNDLHYEVYDGCGFPSAPLLGGREDWVEMLNGLGFISSLSGETVESTACLSKVLEYMAASFDRPQDKDVKTFGMRAVHETGHSGSRRNVKLTGWLTAFSWWDPHGARQKNFSSACERWLALDGVEFLVISASHIPVSTTRCPAVVSDEQGGGHPNAELLAGNPGFQVQDASGTSARPISSWWLLARRPFVPRHQTAQG